MGGLGSSGKHRVSSEQPLVVQDARNGQWAVLTCHSEPFFCPHNCGGQVVGKGGGWGGGILTGARACFSCDGLPDVGKHLCQPGAMLCGQPENAVEFCSDLV